ncbi:MAG: hypothetical protein ACR2JW_03210, partial [Thermomicrobiales bacterium]
YFLVQDGLFTIRSMYLPRSIVARIDEDGAHLAVAKGEAESKARQDLPNEGDAWYGAQPSGIAPASVRVMEIPLREQVLVTRVVATVRSEVHLRRGVTEHIERVATTVRREEAYVESGAGESVHVESARNDTGIAPGMSGTGAARTPFRP